MHLKGGAITSTAPAAQNELTTQRLTFENLHNRSHYSAQSASVSGGYAHNPGVKQPDGSYRPEAGYSDGPQFNPSLPQRAQGSSESATYAVLSEGNIRIGGQPSSAAQLGIRSQADGANEQLAALPDLQRILHRQRTVAQAGAEIYSAAQTYSSNRAKAAQAQQQQAERDMQAAAARGDSAAYAAAEQRKQQAEHTLAAWGVGGDKSRALQAATSLITGALGGQTDIQVAANTLAPYAAAAIGKTVGHGENANEAAQLVGHFLLGAALAYVNGSDPLIGGSAAVASEKTAAYLAEQYNDGVSYNNADGEFEPNRLPENIKQEIRAITGAVASFVGSVSSASGNAVDILVDAQVGGVVGQNAVVNNRFRTIRSPAQVTQRPNLPHYRNLPLQNPQLTQREIANLRRINQLQEEIRKLDPAFKGFNYIHEPGNSYIRPTDAVVAQYENHLGQLGARTPPAASATSTQPNTAGQQRPSSGGNNAIQAAGDIPRIAAVPRINPLIQVSGSVRNLNQTEIDAINTLARPGDVVVIGSGRQSVRNPRDERVNPEPPPAMNPKGRTVGKSSIQNTMVHDDLANLRASGIPINEVRINQQQVNAAGQRVGIGRPDSQMTILQGSLSGGRRLYIEYDRSSSNRGWLHQARLLSNEPNSIIILKQVD